MTKNKLSVLLLLPLLALPAGCILSIGSGSNSSSRASQARSIRNQNLARLESLSIGMSIEEVKQRMGDESVYMGDRLGWVRNPYRSESFQSVEGPIVVLYYYTHVRERDDVIADDELTPVGFARGELIGWGWSFFERTIREM